MIRREGSERIYEQQVMWYLIRSSTILHIINKNFCKDKILEYVHQDTPKMKHRQVGFIRLEESSWHMRVNSQAFALPG